MGSPCCSWGTCGAASIHGLGVAELAGRGKGGFQEVPELYVFCINTGRKTGRMDEEFSDFSCIIRAQNGGICEI